MEPRKELEVPILQQQPPSRGQMGMWKFIELIAFLFVLGTLVFVIIVYPSIPDKIISEKTKEEWHSWELWIFFSLSMGVYILLSIPLAWPQVYSSFYRGLPEYADNNQERMLLSIKWLTIWKYYFCVMMFVGTIFWAYWAWKDWSSYQKLVWMLVMILGSITVFACYHVEKKVFNKVIVIEKPVSEQPNI